MNDPIFGLLANTPHMSPAQGMRMMEFIADHEIAAILELGFAHGVSTCYMATALARSSGGSIVTIDLEWTRTMTPNIEELLGRVGERDRVEVFFEPTSYTWRLMKLLEEDRGPRFDFCYVDGAHSWFVDGFAFFLVDRLLKPGGWIIFDDVNWTYDTSPTLRNSDRVRQMPAEERTTPQVRKIYELLVKTHPAYEEFRLEGDWAFARKKLGNGSPGTQRQIVVEQVVRIERVHVGIGAVLARFGRVLRGR